jgi:hypothetical protein
LKYQAAEVFSVFTIPFANRFARDGKRPIPKQKAKTAKQFLSLKLDVKCLMSKVGEGRWEKAKSEK